MKKNRATHLTVPVVANGHDGIASDEALNHTGVTGRERWIARKILTLTGNPPIIIILWNGEGILVSNENPVARLIIRDRSALYLLMLNPTLYFGELFASGRVSVEGDLRRFLETVYTGIARAVATGFKRLWRLYHSLPRYHSRPRSNTLARSRSNIHHHYDIGKALVSIRDSGVTVIASGALTHNLSAFFGQKIDAPPPRWVVQFNEWLADRIKARDIDALLDYRKRAPEAARNHPTEEHLMPLFVALGAADNEPAERLHASYEYGVLAMDVVGFGQGLASTK